MNARRTEYRSRQLTKRIEGIVAECQHKIVYVYGPYPPSEGRTKWRVIVYDPSTGGRRSVSAETTRTAASLAELLRKETETKPVPTVHEALDQWIEHKRVVWRNAERVARNVENRIKVWIPDVPVDEIDAARASALYLAVTKSEGKFGPLKAATHHGYLKLAKELWRWLLDGGHIENDAFAKVKPIGKANAGKQQLGPREAKTLERLLFDKANQGEEGALAILVQLYLGLRPSEVLGLTVGAVDGINVFVNGTKNKNAKRRLELFAPVAELLATHCEKRPLTERIFARDREKQPTPGWMYKRLHSYCDEAQIGRVCPHSLRGLHSSLALEAGATSNDVARSLGHSSFAITAKHYAKADSIEVGKARRVADSLHGPK
ncbi:MAG: tyrosine-type recombinase/integrase [Myxococcales bacterium]|nr:tyrosine-type recombinase/integrase [Myxococcales bacterium]